MSDRPSVSQLSLYHRKVPLVITDRPSVSLLSLYRDRTMSNLIPSDINKTGCFKNDVWLQGNIVRTRVRKPQGNEQTTGKNKGKKSKGNRPTSEGMEVHICGGHTAADVMLVETWDAAITKKLLPFAKKGTPVAFSNFIVKSHTEKTGTWTTSRLPFYAVLTNLSEIKKIDENPDWLTYHPLTTMTDLELLPDGMLVCVAGRIMPEQGRQPQKADRNIAGEQVSVTNAVIRNANDMIQMSAWRALADQLACLEVEKAYMFEGVRVFKDKSNKSECRYTQLTINEECCEQLSEIMEQTTAIDRAGAVMLSSTGTRRDFSTATCQWWTLSMCRAICDPGQARSIKDPVLVPAVYITDVKSMTYTGCAKCKKAYREGASACSCAPSSAEFWKADLVLTDHTAQQSVTIFDPLQELTDLFEEGGTPEDFKNEPEKVEEYHMNIMATPLTVLVTFDENAYLDKISVTVRKARPTVDFKSGKVHHPLTAMPRYTANCDAWPPTMLSETSFAPGIGMSRVHTGAVKAFRALVRFTDKPQGIKRPADQTTLKLSRTCTCCLQNPDDQLTYNLVQNGPLEVVSRLLSIKKDDCAHVVLAWRGTQHLTILAACTLDDREYSIFLKFFKRDLDIHKEMFTNSKHVITPEEDSNNTPMKVCSANQEAAKLHAAACLFDDTNTI